MKSTTHKLFLGLMIVVGVVAKAGHNSPSGSVGRLFYETQELVQTVRYVGLNYNVQQAVNRFHQNVVRLADCVRFNSRIGSRNNPFLEGDHLDGPDFRDHNEPSGVPYQCRPTLDMARQSFRPVDRYLNDTHYDYPQVYRSYIETREALFSLQLNNYPGPSPFPAPSPQPIQVSCVAVDMGWEEHGGGHLGYGFNVIQAQRSALGQCQRFHGRCRIQQCR